MILSSRALLDTGFPHGFAARDASEQDLFALLGTPSVTRVRQVHGGRVVEASAALGQDADAIVARRPAATSAPKNEVVAVGVRVADCAPVLLANLATGDVAAVHAGWRGVVARVVAGAVEALGGGRLVAATGPCIGPCCFEVGRDVAEEIARACGDGTVVSRVSGEKAYVDLRGAIRAQLRSLGLAEGDVEDVPGCTKHDAHFHSYRRDGPGSGRMLAAIATRR